MSDFDARDYGSGSFVKKAELRASGPRRFVIEAVEEGEGFPDRDGKRAKELVLVFADGSKFGLGTKVNRTALIDMYGPRTSRWIGKSVELVVDLSVSNPRGGEAGGIRIRRPDEQQADDDGYISDLEEAPSKGNGAEQAPARLTSRRV